MSLDLEKFMEFVRSEEGVDRAKMVVMMGIKRWGNSRIANAMNIAESGLTRKQELFVQRKRHKKFYFTWEYAMNRGIPAQIGAPVKPREPKSNYFIPQPNAVDRLWKATRSMGEA